METGGTNDVKVVKDLWCIYHIYVDFNSLMTADEDES